MSEFYRIKKLPPYVFNTVNTLKMNLRRDGQDIIDFGMGIQTKALLILLSTSLKNQLITAVLIVIAAPVVFLVLGRVFATGTSVDVMLF